MALFDFLKKGRPGRNRKAPERDTIQFPSLVQSGQWGQTRRLAIKPTPRNLRYFARTPYARRAVNAIKNPIALLDWEIAPMPGVEMNADLEKQIDIAA